MDSVSVNFDLTLPREQSYPQKYKQIYQTSMRSTLTERYLPKKMDAEELDDLLARGWYRMGVEVFTCKYLFFRKQLYSPSWLRLPLQNYQFRKSLRKIFNRNNRKYRIVYGPQKITAEKRKLYQKYRKKFDAPLSVTLISNLQDAKKKTVFNTWECCVYDGKKLVACSFFDLGAKSMMSIMGMFDHDYAQDSLGFYTMLLEIDYGLQHDFEYYYPGYITPGHQKFDYKLRIGKKEEVQFFDFKTDGWKSFATHRNEETLMLKVKAKLMQLGRHLTQKKISCNLLFYPSFEQELIEHYKLHGMKSPMFLSVFSDFFLQPRFIIYYDYFEENYHFYECVPVVAEAVEKNKASNASEPFDFLKKQNLILQHTDFEEIAKVVGQLYLRILAKVMTQMEQFKPPNI